MKKTVLIIAILWGMTLGAFAQLGHRDGVTYAPIALPPHGLLLDQDASIITTLTQTLTLAPGVNWVSFYVETDLDALKAALVAALPGTTMKISSKTQALTYNGTRRRGNLSALDVALMYRVDVPSSCEITQQGMPIDPAEHPITITHGSNWIGFPFSEIMTVNNAFAGFALNGDKVKTKTSATAYNGTRWRGNLSTLEPGQGYIYESASNESRTLVFPTSAK